MGLFEICIWCEIQAGDSRGYYGLGHHITSVLSDLQVAQRHAGARNQSKERTTQRRRLCLSALHLASHAIGCIGTAIATAVLSIHDCILTSALHASRKCTHRDLEEHSSKYSNKHSASKTDKEKREQMALFCVYARGTGWTGGRGQFSTPPTLKFLHSSFFFLFPLLMYSMSIKKKEKRRKYRTLLFSLYGVGN
jgi:hypothetical protein